MLLAKKKSDEDKMRRVSRNKWQKFQVLTRQQSESKRKQLSNKPKLLRICKQLNLHTVFHSACVDLPVVFGFTDKHRMNGEADD